MELSTNENRVKDLYRMLDDAHTELKDEATGSDWLPSFREWLDTAARDPYHAHNLEAKEYLSLEAAKGGDDDELDNS